MDRGMIRGVPIACLALALLWAPVAAGRGAPYDKGDHVLISGQVRSTEGEPVGNVTVLLELSRTAFSLKRFKQVKRNTLQIPVVATVAGQYFHDWRWDGYYNTFELAVALPIKKDGRDDYEILHRVDVTGNVLAGGPVAMPLVIGDGADLGWARRLLDGSASAEESRIFREMGRPDRFASEEDTAAWWYFEAGKVYRFRAGALEQVEHFEPIKPL